MRLGHSKLGNTEMGSENPAEIIDRLKELYIEKGERSDRGWEKPLMTEEMKQGVAQLAQAAGWPAQNATLTFNYHDPKTGTPIPEFRVGGMSFDQDHYDYKGERNLQTNWEGMMQYAWHKMLNSLNYFIEESEKAKNPAIKAATDFRDRFAA